MNLHVKTYIFFYFLNRISKFECSVHMVAKDWYLTSARCVEKGVSKTKSKTSWMAYGGCHVESEDDYVVSVSSSSFSIGICFILSKIIYEAVIQTKRLNARTSENQALNNEHCNIWL